jgi:hypothetical protein
LQRSRKSREAEKQKIKETGKQESRKAEKQKSRKSETGKHRTSNQKKNKTCCEKEIALLITLFAIHLQRIPPQDLIANIALFGCLQCIHSSGSMSIRACIVLNEAFAISCANGVLASQEGRNKSEPHSNASLGTWCFCGLSSLTLLPTFKHQQYHLPAQQIHHSCYSLKNAR